MNQQSMIDHATNAAAGAAVSSPVWLPSLREMSDTAGLLLPILGATWLVVQITLKLADWLSRSPRNDR